MKTTEATIKGEWTPARLRIAEDAGKGYQGWTNHATWCVALHLGNSQGWYQAAQDMVEAAIKDAPECPQVKDGIWSEQEAARITLEEALKATVEEILMPEDEPRKPGDAYLFQRDMMRGYFEDVNWHEIAGNYLSDEDGYSALAAESRKPAQA